jgi:hypothetical protein
MSSGAPWPLSPPHISCRTGSRAAHRDTFGLPRTPLFNKYAQSHNPRQFLAPLFIDDWSQSCPTSAGSCCSPDITPRRLVSLLPEQAGADVAVARTLAEACSLAAATTFEAVLTDAFALGPSAVFSVTGLLRREAGSAPLFLITAHHSLPADAPAAGFTGLIAEPSGVDTPIAPAQAARCPRRAGRAAAKAAPCPGREPPARLTRLLTLRVGRGARCSLRRGRAPLDGAAPDQRGAPVRLIDPDRCGRPAAGSRRGSRLRTRTGRGAGHRPAARRHRRQRRRPPRTGGLPAPVPPEMSSSSHAGLGGERRRRPA